MTDQHKELLEKLFDFACSYYVEESETGHMRIPDNQSERDFIQEVFMTCADVLGKFDSE